MTELKPCPFCGEMPETEVEVTQMGGGEDHVDFKVVCKECGTEKAVRLTIRQKCDFGLVEQAMTHAASSWNRRVVKGKDGEHEKLIELDAALDGVANILDYEIAKGHSGSISRKGVVDMLTTLPTVDAVPVRHGRWIYNIDDLFPAESTQECDQCHEKQPLTCDDNYCPNCGAKMDGDTDGV